MARSQRLRHVLATVAKAVTLLEQALGWLPPRNRVCSLSSLHCCVGLIVTGYHIIGPLEASGVFRSVIPGPPPELANWLGDAAIRAVDEIVAQRPPRFAEDIYSVTCEEQKRNFCGQTATNFPWRNIVRTYCPMAPSFSPTRMRSFVVYIDKGAAASALIRGACRPSDVHRIAQFSHVILHGLGCRTWIEWIDSDGNCSDGLSRLGLADPWTLSQGWSLQEYIDPPELTPSTFLATFKSHVGMSDSG